ncbi:hypothetical protein NE237_002700 [Protea cynaroides]|uniref:Uncharacterized protein n=1 Tax=Protea cynaroides TaxID=273540 RepID=A0A9Q0KFZ2_9MAGN|nr:hypothetical protein NE237_002700 [Protea cynaroides]
MSGVWVFKKNGVVQLVRNPTREAFEFKDTVGRPVVETAPGARLRTLVYVPTNQVVKSYAELDQCLLELGWKRYNSGLQNNLIQYHRSDDTVHLISLPNNFADLKSIHLYDIAVKNRSFFQVRDCTKQ